IQGSAYFRKSSAVAEKKRSGKIEKMLESEALCYAKSYLGLSVRSDREFFDKA
ncbi:hypothetical protein KUCAC02_011908, partial [Chaenocephalus aceratus]